MTHVVHPYSQRLGIIRDWKSRWFGGKDKYRDFLKSDVVVRDFLERELRGQFVSSVEIERGEKDRSYRLKLSKPKTVVPELKRRAPRYTPVSKRQDRPNAILWLLRHHPELKEAAIIRLVGTTKSTIQAIRDRTHWNSANLQPLDPVTLGLCSQIDLDREVEAAAREAGIREPQPAPAPQPDALMPVEESLQPSDESGRRSRERFDPDAVFAGLKAWTRGKERREEDEE